MVAVSKQPYITPEQYLSEEQQATGKNEYYDGTIVAKSGASPEHNRVVINLAGEMHSQLTHRSCEPFNSDQRIRVIQCNRYYYPDLSIACDEPQFEMISGVQSLLNPVIVFEVMSPSTAAIDRGEKFQCLQTVDSMVNYVLIAQDRPCVEIYTRQSGGRWLYEKIEGLDAILSLPEIGCSVALIDVYDRVSFGDVATQNNA